MQHASLCPAGPEPALSLSLCSGRLLVAGAGLCSPGKHSCSLFVRIVVWLLGAGPAAGGQADFSRRAALRFPRAAAERDQMS